MGDGVMGRRLEASAVTPTAAVIAARAHRDLIRGIAEPLGVSNLRVLWFPGASDDGPLELIVDVELDGRTGLEIFRFARAVEGLLGVETYAGTDVGDAPEGWRVEPL